MGLRERHHEFGHDFPRIARAIPEVAESVR